MNDESMVKRRSGPKLVDIPLQRDAEKEFQALTDRTLPVLQTYLNTQAKLAFTYYSALRREGFTPEQAMDLVTTRFASGFSI